MPACLILMPSERELDVHFSLLKNLGERLGFTVSRIDGDQFSGNLLEPMAKAFSPAELIIADLTGNDPRVMYQLAVAQGIGKRVLIVTATGIRCHLTSPHIAPNSSILRGLNLLKNSSKQ